MIAVREDLLRVEATARELRALAYLLDEYLRASTSPRVKPSVEASMVSSVR